MSDSSYPRSQVEFIDNCPECNSNKLFFEDKRAELICKECGFVISEQIPVIEAMKNTTSSRVLVNPKSHKMAVILEPSLKTPFEKAMTPFYAEIKKLDLKKPVEAEVIRICRECVQKKITRKASKLAILCAATYIVCKEQGISVKLKHIQ